MTLSTLSWYWNNSPAGGTDLLVLLALSDHYPHGWPGYGRIAERCRISDQEAKAAIESLIDMGELHLDESLGSYSLPAIDDVERHFKELQLAYEHQQRERDRIEAAKPLEYAAGKWGGQWPLELTDAFPPKGTHVVYWLYHGESTEPIYIGSSCHWLSRMKQHDRDKLWTRWLARECHNRSQAYRLEAIEIDKHRPPLNKPPRDRRGYDFVMAARGRQGARP